jgi:shikimate dehydrogenase
MRSPELPNAPIFHLVGHPVGHSLSPVIHHAAYAVLGLEASYSVLDCPDRESVERVVKKLRDGEAAGLNVTVPHKKLALELADEVDPSAAAVQAANVLARTSAGRIRAYNTDAPALADELLSLTQERRGALVLGTGGAALAALVSAKMAGFAQIYLSGRRYVASEQPRNWPEARRARELGAEPILWPSENSRGEFDAALRASSVVIQATTAGMSGADSGEELARVIRFDAQCAYYDLVYNPGLTPFLREAKLAGAASRGGLGMLLGQAILALEIWLGKRPPAAPLRAAAEAELLARSEGK